MKTYNELTEEEKKQFGYPDLPEDDGGKKSALSFIQWAIENKIKFIESEKVMYSEEWFVGGTTDLIIEKDGKIGIADIKTMKKIWDRVPHIQMSAYAKMWNEMYGNKVDFTLVLNIPKETSVIEERYDYDVESGISMFEAALKLYRGLSI